MKQERIRQRIRESVQLSIGSCSTYMAQFLIDGFREGTKIGAARLL